MGGCEEEAAPQDKAIMREHKNARVVKGVHECGGEKSSKKKVGNPHAWISNGQEQEGEKRVEDLKPQGC